MTNRQIVMRRVDDLIPYATNARTHSDAQVSQLAASIKEFGWTNPILVADQTILAGHGRLLAARKLGMVEVPTLDLSHLSKTQRKAYVLADNKLALNAGWDEDLLRVEIDALRDDGFDLEAAGFDEPIAITGADNDSADEQQPANAPKACPHCGGAL